MSFSKSRFNKKCSWELLRFATVYSFDVVGGFLCLLNHFKNLYHGDIISYHDKRWTIPSYFKECNFSILRDNPPSFYYVKGNKRYKKESFRKDNIKTKLKIYNEKLSLNENITNDGYFRIWDCGKSVLFLVNDKK